MSSFVALFLALVPATDLSYKGTPRQPNPLAPSLPTLTDAEYEEIDGIIDRFIQYDTGKLKGDDGKKALRDFMDLGPEATLSLIDGFNRAANLQHSCPAVIIGRKLSRLLGASQDAELLEYARENIGAGVTATRHMAVVKDLRVGCMLRKTAVLRSQAAFSLYPGHKPLASMSVGELAAAAGKEKGKNLKKVLAEVEKRKGTQAFETLALAAAKPDKEIQPFARSLLVRHLYRQSTKSLKERLQDERPEVRAAAVAAVTVRKLPWGFELINMLEDSDSQVRQSVRKGLVQLAGGRDFGPDTAASAGERAAAVSRWREWWSMRKTR
jgi:hypothetical protein